MSDTMTARLGLPMLAAGQAQKEVTHNEALLLIDSLLLPKSVAAPQNSPPASPASGQCWLVGAAPIGLWSGQAHSLASWTGAGWRFAHLPVGAEVMVGEEAARWLRISTGWQAPPIVAAANGGTVIDNECRAAIAAIRSALAGRGLILTD